MHRYKFLLALLAIVGICFAIQRSFLSYEPSKLALIPSEDRQFFLKHFRRILTSDLGFTIVGAKPLSLEEFSDYELDLDPKKKQKLIQYLKLVFRNSTRFSLRVLDDDENPHAVFLIDKQAFLKLNEDPDKKLIFETDNIGKLFGYGEGNARFYLRYIELAKYLRKPPIVWTVPVTVIPRGPLTPLWQKMILQLYDVKIPFKVKQPRPNHQFTSLEAEWKWLSKMRNPFIEHDVPPMWIRYPFFVNKKGMETKRILEKFEMSADTLGELLHDEQWFDLVLTRISESHCCDPGKKH